MAVNAFVWFLVTLLVSLSNIVVAIVVYYYLQDHYHKKLGKASRVKLVKDIAFFYAIGMMFALIFSIGTFILFATA